MTEVGHGTEAQSQQETPGTEEIQGGSISGVDEKVPWQPERHQAETARGLAFLLVWILAGSFVLHYVLTATLTTLGNKDTADLLASAFDKWLPVLSGFVGGAVTYYFTKDRRS